MALAQTCLVINGILYLEGDLLRPSIELYIYSGIITQNASHGVHRGRGCLVLHPRAYINDGMVHEKSNTCTLPN